MLTLEANEITDEGVKYLAVAFGFSLVNIIAPYLSCSHVHFSHVDTQHTES
jgi:hypothetical protein